MGQLSNFWKFLPQAPLYFNFQNFQSLPPLRFIVSSASFVQFCNLQVTAFGK